MSSIEGFAPYGEYQTWYRVTGDITSGKPPLIVAHGGPGCTHDYVDSFKDIAATGRAVIHYDQVGNGKSTHLPDKGGDFWTVAFFKAELHNLIDHLGIRGAYCLLGQSWGGMLGAEFAVDQPEGLKALVIANSPHRCAPGSQKQTGCVKPCPLTCRRHCWRTNRRKPLIAKTI